MCGVSAACVGPCACAALRTVVPLPADPLEQVHHLLTSSCRYPTMRLLHHQLAAACLAVAVVVPHWVDAVPTFEEAFASAAVFGKVSRRTQPVWAHMDMQISVQAQIRAHVSISTALFPMCRLLGHPVFPDEQELVRSRALSAPAKYRMHPRRWSTGSQVACHRLSLRWMQP